MATRLFSHVLGNLLLPLEQTAFFFENLALARIYLSEAKIKNSSKPPQNQKHEERQTAGAESQRGSSS